MILEGTDISIEHGVPNQRIFVVAVNYERFENWCRGHDINHRVPNVIYIRREDDLHGQVNSWYKDLGATFKQAQWVYDMLDWYKETRGFKEILS